MYTTKKGGMIMKLSNMSKMSGFTLAEVLITLGIIGVVAAMTMPTLINSTQGAQYKAAFKKALSVLSQAVTLNVALDEWDFGELDADSTDYTLRKLLETRTNYVNIETGAIDGYTIQNPSKSAITAPTGTTNTTFFFNDGMMFSYTTASAEACTTDKSGGNAKLSTADKKKCSGFIDVNGTKGPNKVVVCDGADGAVMSSETSTCKVSNPTDIYPVTFLDTSVLPSSDAARAVLYGK